ncbi:unnamed protein product [Vitrella brassicaformis CCMP3155]|uniref:Uncharacterized protein n=2 Tax=Vitrella brassicaformis TaxID=1169539 RepID=A0A0G4FRP9_VITBC|nr:unnamed protein product [Vitrella brassicaformis CCMP3155]|mmetsp:Transcript_32918/g.94995  ORF Transcript_32918/g.94995 Transcript_32918/m.94995 type:complete len:534 (-) Transcript_32918:206-1807(-)|eukprot:CEM17334.1 unnamed protein product [Vitrella brassicaformis CCMP3155]
MALASQCPDPPALQPSSSRDTNAGSSSGARGSGHVILFSASALHHWNLATEELNSRSSRTTAAGPTSNFSMPTKSTVRAREHFSVAEKTIHFRRNRRQDNTWRPGTGGNGSGNGNGNQHPPSTDLLLYPRVHSSFPVLCWSCGECAACMDDGGQWRGRLNCENRRLYANSLVEAAVFPVEPNGLGRAHVYRAVCLCGHSCDDSSFFGHLARHHCHHDRHNVTHMGLLQSRAGCGMDCEGQAGSAADAVAALSDKARCLLIEPYHPAIPYTTHPDHDLVLEPATYQEIVFVPDSTLATDLPPLPLLPGLSQSPKASHSAKPSVLLSPRTPASPPLSTVSAPSRLARTGVRNRTATAPQPSGVADVMVPRPPLTEFQLRLRELPGKEGGPASAAACAAEAEPCEEHIRKRARTCNGDGEASVSEDNAGEVTPGPAEVDNMVLLPWIHAMMDLNRQLRAEGTVSHSAPLPPMPMASPSADTGTPAMPPFLPLADQDMTAPSMQLDGGPCEAAGGLPNESAPVDEGSPWDFLLGGSM